LISDSEPENEVEDETINSDTEVIDLRNGINEEDYW